MTAVYVFLLSVAFSLRAQIPEIHSFEEETFWVCSGSERPQSMAHRLQGEDSLAEGRDRAEPTVHGGRKAEHRQRSTHQGTTL